MRILKTTKELKSELINDLMLRLRVNEDQTIAIKRYFPAGHTSEIKTCEQYRQMLQAAITAIQKVGERS